MLVSVKAPPATVRPRVPPKLLLLSARMPPNVVTLPLLPTLRTAWLDGELFRTIVWEVTLGCDRPLTATLLPPRSSTASCAAAEHEVSAAGAVRERVRRTRLQHARRNRRVARVGVGAAEIQHARAAQGQSVGAGDWAADGQCAAADVDRRRGAERHGAAAQVQRGGAYESEARVPVLAMLLPSSQRAAAGIVQRAAVDIQDACAQRGRRCPGSAGLR